MNYHISEQQVISDLSAIRAERSAATMSRLLTFETLEGTETISYNDESKETVIRDPDGAEYVTTDGISVDEINSLDAMYDTVQAYERGEIEEIERPDDDSLHEWDDFEYD